MKKYFLVVLYAVFSLLLGLAAAWPLVSLRAVGNWLGFSLFICLACVFFLEWLPKRRGLPVQIFVAMVAGIAAGWFFAFIAMPFFISDYLGIFGKLFILLLKVVIVPLIFVSVLCGVAGIGDVRKLGALGAKTLIYYFCTTAIAVSIGLLYVNVLQPGAGRSSLRTPVSQEAQQVAEENWGQMVQNKVLPSVIQNPVMAGQNPLVIIFFAILLGCALAVLGKEGESALAVFRSLDKAFVQVIMWVMYLAPIGVFALMARVIAELGIDYLFTLAKYCFTVLFGLGTHFCILVFIVCPLLGGCSPRRFLRGMIPVFEVAFSTSSSSATLPITIECTSERVGADKNICNFMLPVGATINMDGTALYITCATLTVAQVYGIELSFQQQFYVFLSAVFSSIGAAGIPGSSIGLMGIIFASVGVPAEGVAIIIGVDRILDMARTTVNVSGDSVGAVVVSRSEGALNPPRLGPGEAH